MVLKNHNEPKSKALFENGYLIQMKASFVLLKDKQNNELLYHHCDQYNQYVIGSLTILITKMTNAQVYDAKVD